MSKNRAEIELVVRANSGLLRKDLQSMRKASTRQFRAIRKNALRTFAGIGLILDVRDIFRGIGAVARGFAEYEKALSNVQAKTGVMKTDMGGLREEIRKTAVTTKYNLRETADAAGYLAQAGLNIGQITNAIKPTLDLAAATAYSAARAADIVTNVATPLGFLDSAEDLTRVADVLAHTSARTNVDLGELGEAFSYAASTVNPLNSTLEETAAVIGYLGNAGVKGSRAGTFYRQSLTALGKGATDASGAVGESSEKLVRQAEILNKLGVTIKTPMGEMRNFIDIMEDLGKSGASASDIIGILGSRAGTTAIALFNQGIPSVREFADGLDVAWGSAARMAGVQLDNLHGDFLILASNVVDVANAFAQAGFGESLRKLAKWLIKVTQAAKPAAIAIGTGLGIAIALLIEGLQKLWDLLAGPFLPLFVFFLTVVLVKMLTAATIGLAAFATAMAAAVASTVSMAAVAGGLASGVILIISAAVLAIGTLVYLALEYSNAITAFFKTLIIWIGQRMVHVKNIFIEFINDIKREYQALMFAFGFGEVEVELSVVIPSTLREFQDILHGQLSAVQNTESALDGLKRKASEVVNSIKGMLGIEGPQFTDPEDTDETENPDLPDEEPKAEGLMGLFSDLREVARETGIYMSLAFKNSSTKIIDAMKAGGESAKDSLLETTAIAIKSSVKLQKIAKAVAIGETIFHAGVGIMRAFKDLPFYLAVPAAASIAIRGIVEVNRIKSTPIAQAHGGLTNVPSTGTYFLEQNERVLDRNLNMDLKDYLYKEKMGGARKVYLKGSDIFRGDDIHRAFGGEMGTVVLQADVR